MNRAFSARVFDFFESWGVATRLAMSARLWRYKLSGVCFKRPVYYPAPCLIPR